MSDNTDMPLHDDGDDDARDAPPEVTIAQERREAAAQRRAHELRAILDRKTEGRAPKAAGDSLERIAGPLLTTQPTRHTTCPDCGRPLTQMRAPVTDAWVPDLCPLCDEQRYRERARARADHAAAVVEYDDAVAKLLHGYNVPRQYRNRGLDTFDPTWPARSTAYGALRALQADDVAVLERKLDLAREYVTLWPRRFDRGSAFLPLVVLTGKPGTGKTHLAFAIGHELVVRYQTKAMWATLGDVIRRLRATGRRDAVESEHDVLHRYREAEWLFLDEVSRHALYGEPTQHLYDVLAYREANLLPTIVSTNETASGFEDFVGAALASRAARDRGTWGFPTMDYRVHARDITPPTPTEFTP